MASVPSVRWQPLARLRWLAEVSALALCCTYVFTTALSSRVNHNEHMYIAAARLWSDLRLYVDYAFLQAPLQPVVNGMLFELAGHDHLLLLARLHVAFWGLVAVLAMYGIALYISRGDRVLALGAGVTIASHGLFLNNVAESSNYMMPLALAMLSLLAQLTSTRAEHSSVVVACSLAAGLFAGFAVSCKSYYAVPALGLWMMAWTTAGRSHGRRWSIGFAVGLLPLLFYALRDFTSFYFGNLGYHIANADYRRSTSTDLPMTVADKLVYLGHRWWDPLLLAWSVYALASMGIARRATSASARRLWASSGILFVLSLGAVLIPTPIFIHYFGLPLVFLVVFGIAAASLQEGWWRRVTLVLCWGAVLTAPATHDLIAAFPLESVPARVEREADKLGQLLGCSRETYVATLSPILPLEAGCAIYPEFASGPFAFRVADRQPIHVQERLRIVGPGRLTAFLDARPPQAILVGFEPNHDPFLEDYARARGYVESDARIRRRGRVFRASSNFASSAR